MDFWEELRFTAQVMEDSKRVLICEPHRAEEVRARVEAMGVAARYEVRGSTACPPGRVIVFDE